MKQTLENGKKPNFGPDFGLFAQICPPPQFFLQALPLLVVRHCSTLSCYAISKKTDEPNLRKWQKT